MANTINDLYLKYVNKVGRVLENDRYFQYMFEMVQNGTNVLQQSNHILHKVVDERWLSTIEDSLDAIDNIIEKPRRFITTKEEVVPVALAKKITAESVRHLSQNTQFIASNANGDIQPTRVLNVTTEESYNLYENRFVFTLIQRLITFIDKRTDIIFWSTGDERTSTLSVHDKVDDAYEEIEYKVEMTIKNKQSYAENDSDNMEVFKRIDRVRRLVMALRQSGFYSLMTGCTPVRSPIQRTNLMMKDPSYRKCYALWHFLESYDEVGYTIDVRDTALEFDEDYLFQMYTNFINNYVVFKSLLENDKRRIDEAPPKRHKVVKPKFVKQIVEQIVDDYDIPDVEIKKVIIQEVTKAQLMAEKKKAAEEKKKAQEKARAEAEKARAAEKLRKEKEAAKAKADAEKAKEKARIAAEKAKEKAKADAEKAKAAEKARKEREAAKAKADAEKAKEKARIAAEKAKEKAKADAEKAKAAEKAKKEREAARAKAAAEKAKEKAKADAEKAKLREKEKAAKAAERAKAAAAKAKEAEKAKQKAEKDAAKPKTAAKRKTPAKPRTKKPAAQPAVPVAPAVAAVAALVAAETVALLPQALPEVAAVALPLEPAPAIPQEETAAPVTVPAVAEPIPEEPVVEEMTPAEPTAEEAIVEEPTVEEPTVSDATPEEPAVEEASPAEPTTEEAIVEEPAPEEPIVEEPTPEEPVVNEASPEEPAAEQPLPEESAAEQSAPAEPTPAPAETPHHARRGLLKNGWRSVLPGRNKWRDRNNRS